MGMSGGLMALCGFGIIGIIVIIAGIVLRKSGPKRVDRIHAEYQDYQQRMEEFKAEQQAKGK